VEGEDRESRRHEDRGAAKAGEIVEDLDGALWTRALIDRARVLAAPMPARLPAWGIYDVFTLADGSQLFLAVVSDTQWPVFCHEFGFVDWAADAELAMNSGRVTRRDLIIPALRERLGACTKADLMARLFASKPMHSSQT
jgi:crotonobetainyl-CoA:carnitine CoA-transferase CaiB-like acyl-CoA transferase